MNDAAVSHGIGSLGAGDADPRALLDRHDPHDLAVLVGQQGHPDGPDERGVIPVAPAGRSIGQVEHDFGHSRVAHGTPDLRDQVRHGVC